jgi:hypothetical protein
MKFDATGGVVHVYSNAEHLVLQVRRSVDSVDDLLSPSFKVAVELDAAGAAALAAELLTAAASRARRQTR